MDPDESFEFKSAYLRAGTKAISGETVMPAGPQDNVMRRLQDMTKRVDALMKTVDVLEARLAGYMASHPDATEGARPSAKNAEDSAAVNQLVDLDDMIARATSRIQIIVSRMQL